MQNKINNSKNPPSLATFYSGYYYTVGHCSLYTDTKLFFSFFSQETISYQYKANRDQIKKYSL